VLLPSAVVEPLASNTKLRAGPLVGVIDAIRLLVLPYIYVSVEEPAVFEVRLPTAS
jgi:hypothetical protein